MKAAADVCLNGGCQLSHVYATRNGWVPDEPVTCPSGGWREYTATMVVKGERSSFDTLIHMTLHGNVCGVVPGGVEARTSFGT